MILKPRLFRKPRLGHSFTRGLVGLWLFNEGSGGQVFDLSGNRNTGELVSAVTWDAGKYGSALNFAGSDDYVNFGFWDNPSGKCSFIASVRFDEVIGAYEQIASADKSDNPQHRNLHFRRNNAGKLELITWTGNITKLVAGATTLTTGVRWHVAGVCDGVNNYVYVNGVLDATPVASGVMDNDTGVHLLFGARDTMGDLSHITEDLQGQMDFIIRYNRALSVSEIALLYREPFCMFERMPIELWSAATQGGGVPPTVKPMWYYQEMMRRAG